MKQKLEAYLYDLPETGVEFCTVDGKLQAVYQDCEAQCLLNRKRFNDVDVLIEGAKYNGVWLETQPMGGEMYAKRDLSVALNNILIFLRYQRADGRYAGMISDQGVWYRIVAHYDWMQGCALPGPALKMYYHIGEDQEYLQLLYRSLSDFDTYLWDYRDSDGDGCLETWSPNDTGEDNCTKHMLGGIKIPDQVGWGGHIPPEGYGDMPYESAEYMSYSYACRSTLAKISALLKNGQEQMWAEKAEAVRAKVKDYLWDEERKCCFDRDRDNKTIPALMGSSTIKCMFGGLFDQQMADDFIKYHLLNKEEFWTPVPLPSIAVNDPYFYVNDECSNCADRLHAMFGEDLHDISDNSWAGAPQGLTFQRSIEAMLNYDHHAETVLIGRRFLELLKRKRVYVQQYHPYTGDHCEKADGAYGPTMLAALEYISILCGVNFRYDTILWSAAADAAPFTYTQRKGDDRFTLTGDGARMCATRNDQTLFTATQGLRCVTDRSGMLQSVWGICDVPVDAVVTVNGLSFAGIVEPNVEYLCVDGRLAEKRRIAFDYTAC